MEPIFKVFSDQHALSGCVFSRRFLDRETVALNGGTHTGCEYVADSTFGTVLSLDGSSYISQGNLAAANFGTGDFSVECVVSYSSIPNHIWFLDKGVSNNNTRLLCGLLLPSTFRLYVGGVGCAASGITPSLNTYYHFLGVRDGDNLTLYINGVSRGTASGVSAKVISSTDELTIGADNGVSQLWNGSIAQVALYNRALSAQEVADLAYSVGLDDSGTGRHPLDISDCVGAWIGGQDGPISGTTVDDFSGQGNDATATSLSESDLVDGIGGNFALQHDGSADFITVGDLSSESIQAAAFWVKPDSTTESILQLKSSTQRSIEVSSGTVGVTGLSNETVYVNGVASTSLSAGVWSHVAVTFDAVTDADSVLIGKEDTNFYDGAMQNVRLWERQPTLVQLNHLYRHEQRGLF